MGVTAATLARCRRPQTKKPTSDRSGPMLTVLNRAAAGSAAGAARIVLARDRAAIIRREALEHRSRGGP